MKKVSSKIFLLNREDVAVFHSGVPFPGSQFVKIDVPSDVALTIVPVKMEFQEDKTTDHNCNQEAPDRKGNYCLTLNLLHNNQYIWSDNTFYRLHGTISAEPFQKFLPNTLVVVHGLQRSERP